MRQVSLGKRLRYGFDNLMSRGTGALIIALFIFTVIIIALFAAIVVLLQLFPSIGRMGPEDSPSNADFFQAMWMIMLRTLDPGTMGGDQGGVAILAMMLGSTLVGLFIVSLLIGLITSGIEQRLEELRKGRSEVLETNHTVILGWSSQVFAIISELVVANANQKNACVAILASKDKVEMEDEIRDKVGNLKNTRVVCRTGDPIDLNDLEIVSPHHARAIIILSPELTAEEEQARRLQAHQPAQHAAFMEQDVANADAHVIKMILALTNNPNRRKDLYHIVAQIRNPKNVEVSRMVGGKEVELVLVEDLIARITAQTCRQAGLSAIYTELLDFDGDEMYFADEPKLVGKRLSDALFAYEDSAVIGIYTADGKAMLKPPMHQIIEAGDKLVVITQDDDTAKPSGKTNYQIDFDAIQEAKFETPPPERTLILGWNKSAVVIINELDNYVVSGSQVMVVSDPEIEVAKRFRNLRHLNVTPLRGDITDRSTLDELGVASYDHVIVLSYSDTLSSQEADARTLMTLLHLRDIANQTGATFTLVSEMIDSRNRELAEIIRADDFIVSDQLSSLMMAQIAENKNIAAIFEDLFDAYGSEIYMRPIAQYVHIDRPVNFYTLLEAARRRNEIAIGYRKHLEARSETQGIHLNPKKSELITFDAGDHLIVISENDDLLKEDLLTDLPPIGVDGGDLLPDTKPMGERTPSRDAGR